MCEIKELPRGSSLANCWVGPPELHDHAIRDLPKGPKAIVTCHRPQRISLGRDLIAPHCVLPQEITGLPVSPAQLRTHRSHFRSASTVRIRTDRRLSSGTTTPSGPRAPEDRRSINRSHLSRDQMWFLLSTQVLGPHIRAPSVLLLLPKGGSTGAATLLGLVNELLLRPPVASVSQPTVTMATSVYPLPGLST